MKKLIASIMVILAVILLGGLATASPSHASSNTKTSFTTSSGVAKAVPTFVTNSVTPVTSAPNVIGNGAIMPAWRYVSCYWAMNGEQWCWRYDCTYFEYVALGCRNGWYRVSTTWWA